jgi:hypothetical protein
VSVTEIGLLVASRMLSEVFAGELGALMGDPVKIFTSNESWKKRGIERTENSFAPPPTVDLLVNQDRGVRRPEDAGVDALMH